MRENVTCEGVLFTLVFRDISLCGLHVTLLQALVMGVVTLTSVHKTFFSAKSNPLLTSPLSQAQLTVSQPTSGCSRHCRSPPIIHCESFLQCDCNAESQTRTALTLVLQRCHNLDTALRSIPITWRVQSANFPVEPS